MVICKYYATLYKGLEHPRVLVPTGGPGTSPQQILRDTVHSVDTMDKVMILALGRTEQNGARFHPATQAGAQPRTPALFILEFSM